MDYELVIRTTTCNESNRYMNSILKIKQLKCRNGMKFVQIHDATDQRVML